MSRATNAVARKRRKKKVLKQAKGYWGRKHSSYRFANEQVMRSGKYAYRDRRAASASSAACGSSASTPPRGARA